MTEDTHIPDVEKSEDLSEDQDSDPYKPTQEEEQRRKRLRLPKYKYLTEEVYFEIISRLDKAENDSAGWRSDYNTCQRDLVLANARVQDLQNQVQGLSYSQAQSLQTLAAAVVQPHQKRANSSVDPTQTKKSKGSAPEGICRSCFRLGNINSKYAECEKHNQALKNKSN